MRDFEGLIARIFRGRRAATPSDRAVNQPGDAQPDRIQGLEARMAHLEQLVEGLQDSVHRESERHSKLIAELQAQIKPGAMGTALAKDARDRGL